MINDLRQFHINQTHFSIFFKMIQDVLNNQSYLRSKFLSSEYFNKKQNHHQTRTWKMCVYTKTRFHTSMRHEWRDSHFIKLMIKSQTTSYPSNPWPMKIPHTIQPPLLCFSRFSLMHLWLLFLWAMFKYSYSFPSCLRTLIF